MVSYSAAAFAMIYILKIKGYRPLDAENNAGPFEWFTYQEVSEMVTGIGSGILHEELFHTDDSGVCFCLEI